MDKASLIEFINDALYFYQNEEYHVYSIWGEYCAGSDN